jgi:TM2 domain-containing membrane protein YozV
VKHPNFDLMHSILYFSRFVFDEFIAKGVEIGYKVGTTLLLTVWLRQKYDKFYLKESVRGSFEVEFFAVFFFGLPLFMPLVGFAVCSSSR